LEKGETEFMAKEEDLLRGLSEITPITPSLLRMTELMSGDDFSLKEVADIVKYDPGLTADVLRYANSVESAAVDLITDVQHAVSRMGAERIMKYLLAKWMRGQVRIDQDLYGVTSLEVWEHSVVVGLSSNIISEILHEEDLALASFTACILHDIGMVVLSAMASHLGMGTDWGSLAHKDETELVSLEQQIFGLSHAEAGAMLLERWKIPEPITDAVRLHESPEKGHDYITDCIRMGNKVASVLEREASESEDIQESEFPQSLAERLRLSEEDYSFLKSTVSQRRDEVLRDYV